MAFEQATMQDLEAHLRGLPELQALLHHWMDRCHGRAMPARGDFDVIDMKPWLGNLNLVDVERNPLNFRYRVYGTNVADMLRKELTGHRIEDNPSSMVAEVRVSYERVVETRAPFYQRVDFVAINEFFRFHRLLLPLSDDDKVVAQVLVGNTPIKGDLAKGLA